MFNVILCCVNVILKDNFYNPVSERIDLAQIYGLFLCGEDHKLSVALLRDFFFLLWYFLK